jgi:predicted ATPase/class 3 adenylate cyclase
VAELPSGTVTFLFTDLEVSTRLWDREPDAMRAALARHDEILRGAVAAHGGQVVKGRGDGVHAVFATADAAVGAAVACHLAMSDEDWLVSVPLRARIGIHTGVAELRDGDYFGSAVNRAARLEAVAHGGQVVCSQATADLARDIVSEGVGFVDLGEHRLRGLTRPERVFQVTAPGLTREFPPLRSVDALPGNLPSQLTSFVGRREELRAVAKALEEWRLVTLTGTGGVGKTRLALEVAAEVLPGFPDGAWLCELAAADDGETMAQMVAAELRVSQRAGLSLEASIRDFLRAKELLLVLDNCEQLLGPVSAFVENVLRECPRVRILATSREGLGVGGEHVWPLGSLPLPEASGAGIATNDAVRLFVERAESARVTFVLDGASVGVVGDICRRLDGIPLAIELAAARVVSMSPVEIGGLLDERFRLLTGGRRSAVERHQTLRATVDWSYSLLDERERSVFERLGVFAGSFDARAAQAIVVGDGVEAWDVLDALAELVAKSMVNADETTEGTTRYEMLETLRQYARERIYEHGDTDRWRRRHADYFAGWAEEAGAGLLSPDELAWRARERAELDNLRAAVTWALDRDEGDDLPLALRIVAALAGESAINPTAGVGTWAEAALPHLRGASAPLRYAVTAAAASHHTNRGNHEQGRALALAAIGDGIPRDAPAPGLAQFVLGTTTGVLGDFASALEILLDAARMLDRDLPASAEAAYAHAYAAIIAEMSDSTVALRESDVAVRQARAIAHPSTLAFALLAFGWARGNDEPTTALVALDESIALCRHGANPSTFGISLNIAGGARLRIADHHHAARNLREGAERTHEADTASAFYLAVWYGIELLTALDRLDDAAVFDGMVSTAYNADWRTGAGMGHQRAAIAHARTVYGDERYDAAFRVGAAMTYEQAVAHTLRVLDDVVNETSDTAQR